MVPFVLAGTGIAAKGQATYDEVVAELSDLVFEKGHELMKRMLRIVETPSCCDELKWVP